MAVDTALFVLGLDKVGLPEPIAVADFKNGIYSIHGVSKTLAQMFQFSAAWFPFDASMVVAGQGLQAVSSGIADISQGPVATAELFAALSREFVGVADYTTHTTGDPTIDYSSLAVTITDFPAQVEGWDWVFQSNAPYIWDIIFDFSGTYTANRTLPYPQGHYKSAYMFCEELLASSVNGLPSISPVGTPQLNLAANTFGVLVESVSTGAGIVTTTTLHSLKFYPEESPAILPLLSAL